MPRNDEDTDQKIERVAEAAAEAAVKRSKSNDSLDAVRPEHRIVLLEKVVEDHTQQLEHVHHRLNEGNVEFAGIRKDIQHMTEKIVDLSDALKDWGKVAKWLVSIIVLGVLATAGSSIIWVIQHSAPH